MNNRILKNIIVIVITTMFAMYFIVFSIANLLNKKDVYNLKISKADNLGVMEHKINDMITIGKDYYYKAIDTNGDLYIVKADKDWLKENFGISGNAKNDYVEIKGLAIKISEFDSEIQLYVQLTGNKEDKDKIKCINTKYETESIIKIAIGSVFTTIFVAALYQDNKKEKNKK